MFLHESRIDTHQIFSFVLCLLHTLPDGFLRTL